MMEDFAIFNLARKRARKAKLNQQVNRLTEQMSGLKIDDDYDPMDTSNMADGVIVRDENGNEYVCYATRSTKKKQQ
jgi:hypothetical protein